MATGGRQRRSRRRRPPTVGLKGRSFEAKEAPADHVLV